MWPGSSFVSAARANIVRHSLSQEKVSLTDPNANHDDQDAWMRSCPPAYTSHPCNHGTHSRNATQDFAGAGPQTMSMQSMGASASIRRVATPLRNYLLGLRATPEIESMQITVDQHPWTAGLQSVRETR